MAFRREPENVKLTKIKAFLDKNRMSYADLGRLLNYSRDYISRLLRKKRPLTEEFLLRYSEFKVKQSHEEDSHKP